MAKRGRPRKSTTVVPTLKDAQKAKEAITELKMLEAVTERQKEILYKDLAIIKKQVDRALTHIGFMDSTESLAEAAFKAGRAYGPLDEANDKLEEMLNEIYEGSNNLDHWDEMYDN